MSISGAFCCQVLSRFPLHRNSETVHPIHLRNIFALYYCKVKKCFQIILLYMTFHSLEMFLPWFSLIFNTWNVLKPVRFTVVGCQCLFLGFFLGFLFLQQCFQVVLKKKRIQRTQMKQKWIEFEKHPSTSLKVLMPKILNIQKSSRVRSTTRHVRSQIQENANQELKKN